MGGRRRPNGREDGARRRWLAGRCGHAAARAGETSARSGQTEAQLNSTDCGFNGLLLRKA